MIVIIFSPQVILIVCVIMYLLKFTRSQSLLSLLLVHARFNLNPILHLLLNFFSI